MHVLWEHITPPQKTAQTFLLTESKRPSFAMVCWFARLALWSRVLWFCPCFLCSASTLERAATSGPSHQPFLLWPCSPPDTCLASVLVCSGHHDRIPQTGQFKQQTFIFSQAWKTEAHIKVWANLISGENALPGLQTTIFLLCPRMAFPPCNLMTWFNLR